MKNPFLITAIDFSYRAGEHVPPDTHNQYEFVYYQQGQGTISVGTESYSISPNTFVIIPPRTLHIESHQECSRQFYIQIQMEEELPQGMFSDPNKTIYRIMQAIVDESFSQLISYQEMITLKLTELIIEVKRLTLDKYMTQNHPKNFDYVINYISENYYNKIQFKNLAKQLNFSYDYFQHRFKQLTGFSPQQFLIEKRINAAENMLKENDLNCTEISYRCGFSNSAQFSAIFKQKKGITPLQYRKNLD